MLPVKVAQSHRIRLRLPPSPSPGFSCFIGKWLSSLNGIQELMAAGFGIVKINKSVIICTLSSVFKIHAGWDFPELAMCT